MQWRRSTLEILLVSIAVAFEALLLHGETRPMTHLPARASSAFLLFGGPSATMADAMQRAEARLKKRYGGRGKSQSLARLHTQRVSCSTRMSLPAMPALVAIERKTSVTHRDDEEGTEAPEEGSDTKWEPS
jgi:hypothetical protein